jgi:hypothetical protein
MVAIFVVLTFLVLVIADLVVQHYRAPQHVAAIPHPFEPAVAPGLFYDSGHTWTEVLASGRVRIGVDAFIGCALERTSKCSPPTTCSGANLCWHSKRRDSVWSCPLR